MSIMKGLGISALLGAVAGVGIALVHKHYEIDIEDPNYVWPDFEWPIEHKELGDSIYDAMMEVVRESAERSAEMIKNPENFACGYSG